MVPSMRSRFFPLPEDPRWRRLFGVALFLGLLYAFRHLAILFVCFVLISRGLGSLARTIVSRTRLQRARVIGTLLAGFAVIVAGLFILIVHLVEPFVRNAQTEWRTWWDSLQANPAIEKLREVTSLSGHGLIERAREHAIDAVHLADKTAHVLLYLLIGLIVAIMYSFEHDELVAWRNALQKGAIADTLVRWFGYVADAIVATAKIQLVVAVVNAIVTLPVLLLLRMQHIPMLCILIVVSGLVPVVGNIISGAVLCVVAFESRGAWAVSVFVISTFVLHKIESYYLNPRLASQHVHLPALVLVGSLILFEHAFGIVGLFLSFPALYVGSRIRNEFMDEVAAEASAEGGLSEAG